MAALKEIWKSLAGRAFFCVLIGLFFSACAHNAVDGTSATSANPEMAQQGESAEDKEIQKLPTPTSDFGANGIIMAAIPIEVNGEVEKWLEYFQGRGRGHFERYLERSTRYIPLMKKILRENGVPEDLVYIAMIESGFTGKIKSRARAVGYWQFISGTGKHYGLRHNKWLDERWDPVRSTEAAALYFKGLYNLFGNWFLAIASYNVGENRVKSLVMKNYTRDFWELARKKQLPQETIHYIPKFIAASLLAREPEKYGFTGLNYQDPLEFDVLTSKETIDMRLLAKKLNITYEEISRLNPAWKTQYILVLDKEAQIRVPKGRLEEATKVIAEAVAKDKRFVAQDAAEKGNYTRYRVRKGDTLSEIAEQFDVSVEELKRVNGIRRPRDLRPGKSLRIPSSAYEAPRKGLKVLKHASRPRPEKSFLYTVKRGDTLIGIARRHGVTLDEIRTANKLASNIKIQKGQRIVIPE